MPEIDGRYYSFSQPICADCFDDRYPNRVPSALKEDFRKTERCAICGLDTKEGIYFRADPRDLEYPTPRTMSELLQWEAGYEGRFTAEIYDSMCIVPVVYLPGWAVVARYYGWDTITNRTLPG